MTRLRTCDACARHVFATEPSCPFCHAQLAAAPEPVQVAVPAGASRAQRLALAAAIGGSALLGCAQDGDNAQTSGNTATAGTAAAGRSGGSTNQQPGGTVAPIYGAPVPGNPPGQAGRVAQPTAGNGSIEVPVYGAPVAGAPAEDEDAGVPEAGAGAAGAAGAAGSGGTSGQAGRGTVPVAGTVAVPLYGAPMPEYGAPPPPKD